MSFEDLQKSGLPLTFASTKVTKKTEKNRKKKAQKKTQKNKQKANVSDDASSEEYNYAEEFKVTEVLSEYKQQFTILMTKSDRFKSDDQEEEEDCDDEIADTELVNEAFVEEVETVASPVEVSTKISLQKYFHQRYDYFSLFDSGIQIDEEGWYSVTPEIIANHIAKEAHTIALTNKPQNEEPLTVIVDAFCGVGGNTIQFAKYFDKVIAIDLDLNRLEMAKHNASIYGVDSRIEFIHGDVFDILPNIKERADLVFMSPPWGGPNYINQSIFCPRAHLLENRGQELFKLGRSLSKNLILFLPRQTNIYNLAQMVKDETDSSAEESFVVEQHWLKNRLKAISVYFY